jgi:DNA adenine methylase
MLRRRVEATPFSQLLFNAVAMAQATEYHGNGTPEENSVNAAYSFFIKYRQSRQGLGKDFATLSRNRTRRGMNEQVSSWISAIEGLPEAHERLKRVVILNDDAVKVIKQQDGKNTLFYCDPPYLHETRVTTGDYEREMRTEQHAELLKTLGGIEGKFILSGYPSELYRRFEDRYGWRCDEIKIDNKASSKKTKDIKTECLWMNS